MEYRQRQNSRTNDICFEHQSNSFIQIKMPDSESNAEKGMGSNGAASNGSNADKPEPTETQKQQLQIQQQQPQGRVGYMDRVKHNLGPFSSKCIAFWMLGTR